MRCAQSIIITHNYYVLFTVYSLPFFCALQQLVISNNRLSPAVVIISIKEILRDGKMLSKAQK